jgi:hypothetical protein
LSKPQCVYAGFDPTADGLHFGNLLVIMTLLHMLRNGHRVVCLIGDATACIGDPSDKNGERPQMNQDTIRTNSAAVSADISRVFANHRKYFWTPESSGEELSDPIIVHNNDWYRKRNVIDFIGQVGRGLRMTDMLGRKFVVDRVKSREGLSFTEFSYQVFQGYDWLHLFNTYGCRFQVISIHCRLKVDTKTEHISIGRFAGWRFGSDWQLPQRNTLDSAFQKRTSVWHVLAIDCGRRREQVRQIDWKSGLVVSGQTKRVRLLSVFRSIARLTC